MDIDLLDGEIWYQVAYTIALLERGDKLTKEDIKMLSNKIHDIIVSRIEPPVKPACEIRRPQFRDYLPADTTTQTITDIFLANKESYRYMVALDGYIDELESKSV